MEIKEFEPSMTAEYEEFIQGFPGGLFYYSSRYRAFLVDLLNCDERYLLAMKDGSIEGVLPLMYIDGPDGKVYNSLPYYGSHGGILSHNPEAIEVLSCAYNKIATCDGTASSIIVSNLFQDADGQSVESTLEDFRIGQFTDISYQDDARSELMGRIDSSARRNVKRAIANGVTVRRDCSCFGSIMHLHQENISSIGGTPKSARFFDLVPQHFKPERDYDLYVAEKDGALIACLLLFYYNNVVEYFTPAIDAEYRPDQPLALIIMTAMTEAAERGFRIWNWGGTWESQTGVHRFKKKWAAEERNYKYHIYLNNRKILERSKSEILENYPNFYVLPFSELAN
jgi:hypothetical protein